MPHRIKSRAEQEVQARNANADVPTLVRELYEVRRLSQDEVARELGVHRSTLVRWMRDWRIPTRDRRAVASLPADQPSIEAIA